MSHSMFLKQILNPWWWVMWFLISFPQVPHQQAPAELQTADQDSDLYARHLLNKHYQQ